MSDRNGNPRSPTKAVARNMVEVAHDVVALAELQAQLAKAEVQSWVRSILWPIGLLTAALLVVIGCIPVLLLSLAYVLIEFAGLSQALSLLIAALTGLAIAGICAGIGLRKLRTNPHLLVRSRDEFNRNVNWIKQVLRHKSAPQETDGDPQSPQRPVRRNPIM